MKQRNPFRFVALRGIDVTKAPDIPRATYIPVDIPRTPASIPSVDEDLPLITAILRLLEQGVPVDEARRRIAGQFMDSADYVFRNPLWKPFLTLRDAIAALVAETRANGTHAEFALNFESLVRQNIDPDFDLGAFLAGPDYAAMRAQLWQSYFAHIIMQTVRPQDRPVLAFWIRVFEILERIKNGLGLEDLLDRFDEIKPAIPLLVAGQRAQRVQVAPAETEDDAELAVREARFRAASASHDRLVTIHATLGRRLREKLAVKREPEAVLAQAVGETGDEPTPAPRSAEAVTISDPWMFDDADLSAEDRRFLDERNILLVGQSIQDISARIERAISAELGEMRDASTENVIVNVGGIFVRRKRRRQIAPVPEKVSGDDYQ